MKKYDIEKNAKFLNGMSPSNVEKLILFLSFSALLVCYVYNLDILLSRFFTFVFMMEAGHMVCWCVHSMIHCYIAKKRGVPHGLKED